MLGVVAVILVAVVIGATGYYLFFSPVIEVSTVDHKAVTGVKALKSYTILLYTPGGIIVKDKNYEKFFSDRDVIINKSFEDEMQTDYSEIKYLVSIRLLVKNQTLTYFVTRDDFNKLRTGMTVKFEIEGIQRDRIKRLLEY